jgi:hypothetical protein
MGDWMQHCRERQLPFDLYSKRRSSMSSAFPESIPRILNF